MKGIKYNYSQLIIKIIELNYPNKIEFSTNNEDYFDSQTDCPTDRFCKFHCVDCGIDAERSYNDLLRNRSIRCIACSNKCFLSKVEYSYDELIETIKQKYGDTMVLSKNNKEYFDIQTGHANKKYCKFNCIICKEEKEAAYNKILDGKSLMCLPCSYIQLEYSIGYEGFLPVNNMSNAYLFNNGVGGTTGPMGPSGMYSNSTTANYNAAVYQNPVTKVGSIYQELLDTKIAVSSVVVRVAVRVNYVWV